MKQQKTANYQLILLIVLALATFTMTTIAVIPNLREEVKQKFLSPKRKLLAKINGRLSDDFPKVTVLKVSESEKLFVEIYNMEKGPDSPELIQKLELSDRRDGYIQFRQSSTNLLMIDATGDTTMEIVAPTYDDQMTPHLNIFRFISESKTFDLWTGGQLPE